MTKWASPAVRRTQRTSAEPRGREGAWRWRSTEATTGEQKGNYETLWER